MEQYGFGPPVIRVEQAYISEYADENLVDWKILFETNDEARALETMKDIWRRMNEDDRTGFLELAGYTSIVVDGDGRAIIDPDSRMVMAKLPPPAPEPAGDPEP